MWLVTAVYVTHDGQVGMPESRVWHAVEPLVIPAWEGVILLSGDEGGGDVCNARYNA